MVVRFWLAKWFGLWIGRFLNEELQINKLANHLGVALDEQARQGSTGNPVYRTHEIQRRIREDLALRRGSWIVALTILSAMAACWSARAAAISAYIAQGRVH